MLFDVLNTWFAVRRSKMQSIQAYYKSIALISAVVLLLLLGGQRAWAQGTGLDFFTPVDMAIHSNGTLLVIDQHNRRRSVVRVDPLTGNRTTLSADGIGEGQAFAEPSDIVVENDQFVLVVDEALDAVLRVDVITGARVLISGCPQEPDPCPVPLVGAGPGFENPVGIAIGPDGTVVVIDVTLAALIRVDAVTGDRTIVSGPGVGIGPAMLAPRDVVSDGAGGWFVTDEGLNAVFRIDPVAGTRAIVSDAVTGIGPAFRFPEGIDMAIDGALLVTDAFASALIRVDPFTGDRAVMSSATMGIGPTLLLPVGVEVAADGSAFVVDQSYLAIFQVNTTTGDRTVTSRAPSMSISPPSGRYVNGQTFDLALIAIGAGNMAINITATLNDADVLPILMPCLAQSPLPGGGVAIRCPNAGGLLGLTPGRHVLQVGLALFDNVNLVTSPRLTNEVVWEILIAP
jgi:streptogramin lyase